MSPVSDARSSPSAGKPIIKLTVNQELNISHIDRQDDMLQELRQERNELLKVKHTVTSHIR